MSYFFSSQLLFELPYAVSAFFISLVFLYIFRYVIVQYLHQLAKKTDTHWDDVVIKSVSMGNWILFFILSFYVATRFVSLSDRADGVIDKVTLVIFVFYATRAVQRIAVHFLKTFLKISAEEGDQDSTITRFFEVALRIMIWIVAGMLILQNLGYQVTALLGGLGIIGIAVGFSLQNVLEDIFSFFTIYFDKPFRVGEFITIGKEAGTVERIGIKTTRIRTLQGEELVVSNKQLTETEVHNFKKLEKRRVVYTFAVHYEMSVEKIKRVNQIVEKIFTDIKEADLGRVHCTELGEVGLMFEVVYYVMDQDYTTYLNVQQTFNIELLEKFRAEKIKLAYPIDAMAKSFKS